MGSMMAPEEWRLISRCSICTIWYTVYHRDLTLLSQTTTQESLLPRRSYMRLPHFYYYYSHAGRSPTLIPTLHSTHNIVPPPFSNWFLPNTIPAALIVLITVFSDCRHLFPTFFIHRPFSCFPAFFPSAGDAGWIPRCRRAAYAFGARSLRWVYLSLLFSPLRASPSLPTHPVPVWMVGNISTLPRR